MPVKRRAIRTSTRKPAVAAPGKTAALIQANLAAVEAHFHNEAANEVEKACDLYTADAVWEGPARGLVFHKKKDVVANYKKMFAAMKGVSFRNLQRFATVDRVVDDSIVHFTLTGPGFLPVPVGSRVEMRLVHIFEMRSGKIAKEIAYEMWKAV
jgi:ketosteroid isomerase-like protein